MSAIDQTLNRLLTRCWNGALYARYPRAVRVFLSDLGYFPNIVFPKTYNEKMFWRRVFDTNPVHAIYCDKLAVKDVFTSACKQLKVAEVLWTGSDAAGLPRELLDQDVFVKTNNASSRNVRCPQHEISREEFYEQCRRWLSKPYKPWNREWGYARIKPLLFAERAIVAQQGLLEDVKVHLFGGKVYYTMIYHNEGMPGSRSAIFDREGERLRVTNSIVQQDHDRALPEDYKVPESYGHAMMVAEKVAAGSDYLRVDLMSDGAEVYGGEITVYPTGGTMTNSDPAVLADMGRCWNLDLSWFMQTKHTGWRKWYQQRLREHLQDERTCCQ